MHHNSAGTRISPTEIWESRNPWLVKKIELAQDSCGAGEFRGGLGLDLEFEMLEETFVTTVVERTKFPPWGIKEGGEGRANNVILNRKNEYINVPKKTGLKLDKGDCVMFKTGGGGGYGKASKRSNKKILNDLKQDYISIEYAKKYYPQLKTIK